LAERLDEPFWFDTNRYPAYVDIRVRTPTGVLRIIAPKDRVFATRGHIFILWMTVATVLLTGISILFIRNQVRAIERLAMAAEAFGRGQDTPFRPHGAREVRQAARAFLAMKSRIQRHVEQRTVLLASVSHDLRTPLTRLKLHLAMTPKSARAQAMQGDVAEMEHMIDDYLAFARGEGSEGAETVRLAELIGAVCQGAALTGAEVDVIADPALQAQVRPGALKRALANLVMNAASHARRVSVSARASTLGGVEIIVDDDGPGIPPDRREDAFAPFSRLDAARALNPKGAGLGLAIARDVARGHGGDVTLGPSPLGGLQALMRLP
jgi:two-component system osmolarity sensor histidine kinase EnvZ